MPELLKRQFEDGHAFIRELQNSTRKIQAICEHSKVGVKVELNHKWTIVHDFNICLGSER